MPPAVVNRDDRGRATLRAVRIEQPLMLDGRLDEDVYEAVPAAGDFIEQLPRSGVPATEQSEVWVFFDDRNLYISARCYDSHPEREVVNELRRDNSNLVQNESISLILDTFYDRRTAFFFQTSPLGAIRDQAVVDDGANENWNTIWDVKSGRFEKGWTFEMSIPFKSLRYAGAGPQVWGFNVRRIVKWKNETSYLSAVPASYGTGAINRIGVGGTLVGLETPAQSINLELKPYFVSSLTTDRTAAVPFSNDLTKNVGFDFKYGLTRGLIADATVNTDFAQVEEDVQQVNLTRFSLFFPEKRDFFLEGLGIFSFGGVSSGTIRGANGPTDPEVPVMFFSRQIGLSNAQTVPVRVGGRIAGKAGHFSVGALNIETGDKSSAGAVATNFSVFRLKRDVLRRSSLGIIATRRAPAVGNDGSNLLAGADANFQLFDNLEVSGYYTRTSTPGLKGNDVSYRAKVDYSGDRYGLYGEHILIGDNFNPQVGFLRRDDFRRTFGQVRFSPRTKKSRTIRKLTWQADVDYITDAPATVVQNRELKGEFGIEFHTSDRFWIDYRRDYEFLPKNFDIATGVTVPKGGYDYQSLNAYYTLGQQRRVSGKVAISLGSVYNGTKKEITYTGRGIVHSRFAVEPSITLDWITLPYGDFTVRLINTRVIVTPTPRMALSSLLQYNDSAHTLTSSVRLSWEYIPGSQLFLVYSDGRNTFAGGVPGLMNRSVAVKVTRLLRL
ncbi:MAG: hypothetical protein A3F69_03275 [Acidobacteria bacterium RIFCSPLOWO2_12_FULL_66_10]|nr:MAG: hypothetical protein A3F69_03275 [Acidobacteria bacterium RIFCSPLOWO2_12_FULL_66_10]